MTILIQMSVFVTSSFDFYLNAEVDQVELFLTDLDDIEDEIEELDEIELDLIQIKNNNNFNSEISSLRNFKSTRSVHFFIESLNSTPQISNLYSPPDWLI